MNLLKSLFIFLSPVWMTFVLIVSVLKILESNYITLNTGIILSVLPLLMFLSYIMLFRKTARTNKHLLVISIPSLIGLLIVIFTANDGQIQEAIYAISGLFVTLLYIYWYSDNSRLNSGSLKNSNILPDFTVKDTDGNDVKSILFCNKKSLIFFYRGNWCPLCMAQIDEVAANYKKFEENNIDVIFIAPQSSKNTKALAERFNLSFEFYTDEHNQAAKKLGILHKYGLPMGFQVLGYDTDSVYPTIVATDEQGKIIYNDQTSNYRVRPEPEELFEIFNI